MPFIELAELPFKEPVPGYKARFVHTDHMTLAFWEVEAGRAMPPHRHPHEQVSTLIEGSFELTIDGERSTLGPGSVAVIPPEAEHGGQAQTACLIIDSFYPARDDYR